MTPTATMTVQARTIPNGSEDPWNRLRRAGILDATIIATKNATNIATPPPFGVVLVWIRLSSGSSTNPMRVAMARTAKVPTNVQAAAIPPTSAYHQ
jgi:hypothetical protein